MYTAILKKEFRQHRTLTLACIVVCCLIHCLIYFASRGDVWQSSYNALWTYTYFLSFFHLMAAAASVYAVEHDNNTFGFLRQLPVSPKTIAQGKVSWVLAGSSIVLVCTMFSALFWSALFGGDFFAPLKDACNTIYDDIANHNIQRPHVWEFLFVIVEVFLWGLFCTTRCRRQGFAVIATFSCTLFGIYSSGFLCMCAQTEKYHFFIRLIIAAVVAVFAHRGMLHWFDPETKRSFLRQSLTADIVLFRYPKRIQSPFFALFHQQIRSASIIYPFGIFCFALMIFLCIYYSFAKPPMNMEALFGIVWTISGFGIALFWGMIFESDQKNHTYQFLMRLGIHEGTIWWSRITIPFLCYIPVLLAGLFYAHSALVNNTINDVQSISEYEVLLCLWFIPVALGSYFSISCRHPSLSIMLTIGVGYLLLLVGAYGAFVYHVSPLLSTLPICFAFLIASRLRAKYWLRDKPYWKSWRVKFKKNLNKPGA